MIPCENHSALIGVRGSRGEGASGSTPAWPPGSLLQDVSRKSERSALNEVHLVLMRLLSVFMSRTKSGSKASVCEVC